MNGSNRFLRRDLSLMAMAVSLACSSATVSAIGNTSRLTLGDVTQGGGVVSTSSNPASGAFDRQYLSADTDVAGYLNLGLSIEYGNVDDLVDQIDEASAALEGDGSQGSSDGVGGSGTDVGSVDNVSNPDLEALIDRVADRATRVAAILAFIRTEGYAVGQGGSDLSILINKDVLGGTLRFDVTGWVNASAVGLTEDIQFNADTALAELKAAYNLQPGDPATTFDLSGGLHLTFDPNTRDVSATYDNDSLLLTRAAKVVEFAGSYSRPLYADDNGKLFLGVKPKMTQVGLTRITTRFGDLTDAEDTFEDTLDANFVTQNKFGIDLGVLWEAERYRLGATLLNVTEPEFDFPDVDYSGINNPEIRDALQTTETYVAEHQLKLEGAWVSAEKRWGVFSAFDTNAVRDPAGFETQWGTISTAYTFENIWFNSLRAGASRNFAGNELSYLSVGATMFRFLKLDLSSTLEDTSIDGEKLPRGLGFSLGFNYDF
ncbi:MAG TPA: conjugal transfer protein TraF [Cellvibrio sp.]|nr:conjugal transfer protein TraF [Cellvibrio sp.]